MEKDELDLSPYWAAIRRRWRSILGWVIVGGLVAGGITYALRPTFTAETVLIIPQETSSDPLAALVKSGGEPLEILKGIIESKRNLDYLHKITGMENKDIEKEIGVKTKSDQNQLILDCTDVDGKRAQKIVAGSLTALDEITAEGNLSQSSRQAKLLLGDLAEKGKDLKLAEDKLLQFSQTTTAPVDPQNPYNAEYQQKKKQAEYDLQMNQQQINTILASGKKMGQQALQLPTAMPEIEDLRQKLVGQEYDLAMKRTTLGTDSPDVRGVQAQIEVTKNTIRSEISKHLQSADQRIGPELASLAAQNVLLRWQNDYLDILAKAAGPEGLKAARLLREIKMQQDALLFVRQRYEQAKLQGVSDSMHWNVLVDPYIQDKPTNKRYGLFGALGAIVGLLVGCVFAIGKGNSVKTSPRPSDEGTTSSRMSSPESSLV